MIKDFLRQYAAYVRLNERHDISYETTVFEIPILLKGAILYMQATNPQEWFNIDYIKIKERMHAIVKHIYEGGK